MPKADARTKILPLAGEVARSAGGGRCPGPASSPPSSRGDDTSPARGRISDGDPAACILGIREIEASEINALSILRTAQ